jgi:hypothetical protein
MPVQHVNSDLVIPITAMSFHGVRKISSLITPLTLRELGMPADVARLPEIAAAWAAAVGSPLAEHVQPIRYSGGKLVLRAASPPWVSKVRHSHEALIHRLRSAPLFRELVALEVRAAPAERAARRSTPRVQRVLSARTRRLLESVATDTADPALRAALTRLARHSSR